MSEFYNTLITIKTLEKKMKIHIDKDVRDYAEAVDAIMLEMQAYIDYLLLDE